MKKHEIGKGIDYDWEVHFFRKGTFWHGDNSRDIKEASVSPVGRVRVREVENEFEGTANVKPCRAIVKALGFILSVMKASGELKTEE